MSKINRSSNAIPVYGRYGRYGPDAAAALVIAAGEIAALPSAVLAPAAELDRVCVALVSAAV